jgi:hypothetical protein
MNFAGICWKPQVATTDTIGARAQMPRHGLDGQHPQGFRFLIS